MKIVEDETIPISQSDAKVRASSHQVIIEGNIIDSNDNDGGGGDDNDND
eukprot:CAMPEP_0119556652 /NCGR_PEP_ID=MMETSP1352-20130426/8532_1 /TAXON_ID=265584 /ORGANISM="Stauroneis constricta, Strain CCMP1120" /LENGTH=48 /DNA_ID= /DNA_START= /DNA_END= /DNA_ORIENTATION=